MINFTLQDVILKLIHKDIKMKIVKKMIIVKILNN